jgi:hypothetical protein
LLPGDFRVRGAKRRSHFSRSLSHDFELADDGALMQAALQKLALVETGDESQGVPGASRMSRTKAASRQLSPERSGGIDRLRAG